MELPVGAMFCGECGRAVGARSVPLRHVDSGMPIQPAPESGPRDTVILDPVELEMLGWAPPQVSASAPAAPVVPTALPEQNAVPEPLPEAKPRPIWDLATEPAAAEPALVEPATVEPVLEAPPLVQPEALREPEPARELTPIDEPQPQPQPIRPREPVPEPLPESLPAPAKAPEPAAEIEQDLPPEIEDASEAPLDRVAPTAGAHPDPFPWGDRGTGAVTEPDDLERTILVPRREQGERFIIQFSTGESVTVFGSGLLGRNPTPQPGEYFDQLVSISDPGKSVSKTHLEFGQEAGSFWVGDRFSGNGSIVREPESAPRRLTPGKRYRIVRGTRVDIGEQFFIVS